MQKKKYSSLNEANFKQIRKATLDQGHQAYDKAFGSFFKHRSLVNFRRDPFNKAYETAFRLDHGKSIQDIHLVILYVQHQFRKQEEKAAEESAKVQQAKKNKQKEKTEASEAAANSHEPFACYA